MADFGESVREFYREQGRVQVRAEILEAFRKEQAQYQAEKKPFSGSVRFARAVALIKGENK